MNHLTANPVSEQACEAGQCPLCGGANGCQLCTAAAYRGSCWCMSANIPDELLARVPAELRNKACLCSGCVTAFHREGSAGGAGFDLAWAGVPLSSVNYLRFDVLSGVAYIDAVSVVPEPGTLSLTILSLGAFLFGCRKNK